MERIERQLRQRTVILLVLLVFLLLNSRGWTIEEEKPDWSEILGSETIYTGEEVAEILAQSLAISDEEYKILLEEEQLRFLLEIEELQAEKEQRESRWKTILLIETGLMAGLLIHEIWGE